MLEVIQWCIIIALGVVICYGIWALITIDMPDYYDDDELVG